MKTNWQRIYSFFGFWTFIQHEGYHRAFLVIYWCMFPWLKFYRKIDLIKIDVSKTHSMESHRKRLIALDPSILNDHPGWSESFPT